MHHTMDSPTEFAFTHLIINYIVINETGKKDPSDVERSYNI